MASVTGITAEKAAEIEGASVSSGHVDTGSGHLILEKVNGTQVDAGAVTQPILVAVSAPTTSPGIVNTNAETTLFDLLIPAAKVLAGDILTTDFVWDAITSVSGLNINGTFTIRFKLGSTTLQTQTITPAAARQGFRSRMIIYLSTLTAQRWTNDMVVGLNSSVVNAGTAAENLGTDKHLIVTAQMSVAAPDNDVRPQLAFISRAH